MGNGTAFSCMPQQITSLLPFEKCLYKLRNNLKVGLFVCLLFVGVCICLLVVHLRHVGQRMALKELLNEAKPSGKIVLQWGCVLQ